MCRRDHRAERRREKKRGKKAEAREGGRDAETSRTGKITHFDGIKMSVFPSPISMEIAHLWRARERKGARGWGKEERNHGFLVYLARRLVRTMVCSRVESVKETARYRGIRFLELVQGTPALLSLFLSF